MRDPETDRLLRDMKASVVVARQGGVSIRACIFDATVAAVDTRDGWPSSEARSIANNACRAIEPPTVMAGPPMPKPPALARLLLSLGNRLAARSHP